MWNWNYDIPPLKEYFGKFIKEFCFEEKHFSFDDFKQSIDLGDKEDEEGDYYEL